MLPPRWNPKGEPRPAWKGHGLAEHAAPYRNHRGAPPRHPRRPDRHRRRTHAPIGTNKRNYRHLRPDYLAELIAGIEDFRREDDRYTDVHRRPNADPKWSVWPLRAPGVASRM